MKPVWKFLAIESIGWGLAGVVLYFLVRGEVIPAWLAGVLFAGLVVKDLVLYPLTKKAYEDGPLHGAVELLGQEVVVEDELSPEGFVRAGGERWRARLASGGPPTLSAGARARVRELVGLTLIVEPTNPL